MKSLLRCCWHLRIMSRREKLLISHLVGREEVPPLDAISVPAPGLPTSEERRRLVQRLRPSSWDNRHESPSQVQPGTPVIQCDCCFLRTEEDASMITVLVAIDTVYKQMVKKLSIRKSQSGRIRRIRRTSQSDHPRRL